jgi:hypothetical protein
MECLFFYCTLRPEAGAARVPAAACFTGWVSGLSAMTDQATAGRTATVHGRLLMQPRMWQPSLIR